MLDAEPSNCHARETSECHQAQSNRIAADSIHTSSLHACKPAQCIMLVKDLVVPMQDMRVQAFKCSTDVNSSAATMSQDALPSHQTAPQPQLSKTSHGSSSGWVSRTAALTASIPESPACNPDPTIEASGPPANIFTSHNASQNGTSTQRTDKPGLQNARVAGPTEGGALVGSSAMADSHCGVVVALAQCGEYVCSAGGDAMIKVWKADTLEFVRYKSAETVFGQECHVLLCIVPAPI